MLKQLKRRCIGINQFLPVLIFLLTVFLPPRCQDLSLGFCPLEDQPKTEPKDPGKEVDILSTMFPYRLDSYS